MQTILTDKEKQKIVVVKSFTAMAEIAIKSIIKARKKYKGKFVIELCAPISSGGKGNVEDNLAEMNKAIEQLKKLEYILFNQLPYERRIGELKVLNTKKRGYELAYDMSILLDFYEVFFEKELIDILVFLPDWQSSTGACWEYYKAKKLSIKTRQLKDNWAELIAKGETNIKKLTIKI